MSMPSDQDRRERIRQERRARTVAFNQATKRRYPREFDSKSRLYRIWRSMHFRCYQPAHRAQPRYASKGIVVCNDWSRYAAFMAWAIVSGYREQLQIDRIDNAGIYCPENCRWVTRSINQRNKDDNRKPVDAFGESKAPIEWIEDPRCVVTYQRLVQRLDSGWPAEVALCTPAQNGPRPVRSPTYRPGRLSDDQVRAIRGMWDHSERQIGEMFGISAGLAGDIRRRQAYASVP